MAYFPVFGALSLTFYIVRRIIRHYDTGPTQYFIKSNLETGEALIKKLGLTAGEQVSLTNGSTGFEVHVEARGTGSTYELIGKIEDNELFINVHQKMARGKIYAIDGDVVTVEFNY